jgi:hypothetical protein
LLERDKLDERERRLSAIFSHSEVGRALVRFTTLIEYSPEEDSTEGRLKSEAIHQLESQPVESLKEIRRSLSKLGPEFENEREVLIQFVEDLDLTLNEKMDFLSEVLAMRSPGLDIKQNKFSNAVALITMMQLEDDSRVVEDALRQSLRNQSNYSAKLLLIGIFEAKFPEQAKRIKGDFGI